MLPPNSVEATKHKVVLTTQHLSPCIRRWIGNATAFVIDQHCSDGTDGSACVTAVMLESDICHHKHATRILPAIGTSLRPCAGPVKLPCILLYSRTSCTSCLWMISNSIYWQNLGFRAARGVLAESIFAPGCRNRCCEPTISTSSLFP